MNIKRGLFRLWIVCAVLYAAGTLLIGYQQISQEFNKGLISEIPSYGQPEIPVYCKDARGNRSNLDYRLDEDATEQTPYTKCWYGLSRFRNIYPEYKDVSDEDLVKKTYTATGVLYAPPQPWIILSQWIGFAVGIPLIVLAIGAAFVWAFSGFFYRSTS